MKDRKIIPFAFSIRKCEESPSPEHEKVFENDERIVFKDQDGDEVGYIFPYWSYEDDLHIDIVLNETGKKKWKFGFGACAMLGEEIPVRLRPKL